MTNIANRIAEARKALEINQSELARILSVTPQAVQSWESGKARPRGARLQNLASVLGRSVEWLVTGQDESVTAAEASKSINAAFLAHQVRKDVYATSGSPEEGDRKLRNIAEYITLNDQLARAEKGMRDMIVDAMKENDWFNKISDPRLMMQILTITQAAAEGNLRMTDLMHLDSMSKRLINLQMEQPDE